MFFLKPLSSAYRKVCLNYYSLNSNEIKSKSPINQCLWNLQRIEKFFYGLNNKKIKLKSLIWILGGHVYAGPIRA